MRRAAEIVSLRTLGLSLAQIARVLSGDAGDLQMALAAHQSNLDGEMQRLAGALEKVRRLRNELACGRVLVEGELARLLRDTASPRADHRTGLSAAFDLPWPWGGERFELHDIRRINYIVGSLGSGKTRLAQLLARMLPGGAYLGLERLGAGSATALIEMDEDPELKSRVDQALAWLLDEGASPSSALTALLVGVEAHGHAVLVIDMAEQGLDAATQKALIAHLRRRARIGARPLFLMTRSTAILDLQAVGPDEAIILCPANHSVPMRVDPHPGAPGRESLAMCLASPEVRARFVAQ
jgi:hypothetical protein